MIIITKRGSIGANEEKIKYYKGKCYGCETEFYFSSLDLISERRPNGARYVSCPVCHKALILEPTIFSRGIEEISKEEYMKLVPEKIES